MECALFEYFLFLFWGDLVFFCILIMNWNVEILLVLFYSLELGIFAYGKNGMCFIYFVIVIYWSLVIFMYKYCMLLVNCR